MTQKRTHRSIVVMIPGAKPRALVTAHEFNGPFGRVLMLAPKAEGDSALLSQHFPPIRLGVSEFLEMEAPEDALWVIGPDPGKTGLSRVIFESESPAIEIQDFPTDLLAEMLGPFESYGEGKGPLPPPIPGLAGEVSNRSPQ